MRRLRAPSLVMVGYGMSPMGLFKDLALSQGGWDWVVMGSLGMDLMGDG